MVIKCKKCWKVLWINEKKRLKLKDLDCPECWEESYENRIIIWHSKDKAPHNIDKLLKDQKDNS